MTSPFHAVGGLDGVYLAPRGKLTCLAIRLRDNSLCLYSPVAGLEQAISATAQSAGPISALLAPNHYHNKGLAGHISTFPEATLHCSDAARPRLSKLTGLAFDTLDALKAALPTSITLHEPDGLKTGEVWIEVSAATERALIVTDAFTSKTAKGGAEASLLGTFPRYGVKDASTYKRHATDLISKIAPTILVPCHGAPVRSPQLTSQLIALVQTL